MVTFEKAERKPPWELKQGKRGTRKFEEVVRDQLIEDLGGGRRGEGGGEHLDLILSVIGSH